MSQLLDIRNLSITMQTDKGLVRVVDRLSLQVAEGEIHTLVGESGSGKSLLAKAILGFINPRWQVTADRLWWRNYDLLQLNPEQRRAVTGRDMAMIFQNPASYLDPNATLGEQLQECIPAPSEAKFWWQRRAHRRKFAMQLLHRVGIKDHQQVLTAYPFEVSDGVAQKVSIAMAIAHQPKLLIADEPTTAMEPQTRQQIYRLLAKLNLSQTMSILMITQDLTAVMPETKRISMVYSGQLMECGTRQQILEKPYHPYTQAMLSMSLAHQQPHHKSRLPTLPGAIPTIAQLPIGCRLGPRCSQAQRQCIETPPLESRKQHQFACHFPLLEVNDD